MRTTAWYTMVTMVLATSGCVDLDPSYDAGPVTFRSVSETSSLSPDYSWLAVGGRMRVQMADTSATAAPVITVAPSDTAGSSVAVLDAAVIELRAARAGASRLDVAYGASIYAVSHDALAARALVLVLPDLYYAEPITRVMADETKLHAALCPLVNCDDEDSRRLVDSSLHIVAGSSPAIRQTKWDTFALPDAAGRYDLQLEADAVGARSFEVEIVDAVDGIGAWSRSDVVEWGESCFFYLRGGERVMGRGFEVTPAGPDLTLKPSEDDNCVGYHAVSGPHTLVVSGAGVTQEIEIVVR